MNFLCEFHGMAVQHIFISINESALVRNLTLFSIVAVDNYQLARIIKSYGTSVVGMIPSPSSYRHLTYSW